MYNPQLDTFIQVAEAGSFNKAAHKMYITATAVIKQINLLEERLGVSVFVRTHRGLQLTPAGRMLYHDAKHIINYCEESAKRIKNAMEDSEKIVRIGASPMTPGRFMVELWEEVHECCPELDFQMVNYDNTPEKEKELMDHLGTAVDMYAGIFDQNFLQTYQCAAMELKMTPIMMAVSMKHPLAKKTVLEIEDLYEQKVMVMAQGRNTYIDDMREDLRKNHPEIQMEDFDFLSLEVFNQCENKKGIIMTTKSLREVHPLLKTIPVKWDYKIPFGLIFSKEPSKAVERFLEALQEVRGTDRLLYK